jgi:hypothetical protein
MLKEPWVYKNRVQGLNSKLGTIFVGTRKKKPRACLCHKIHSCIAAAREQQGSGYYSYKIYAWDE